MNILSIDLNTDGTTEDVVTDQGTFYVLTNNDAFEGTGGVILDGPVGQGSPLDADDTAALQAAILDYKTKN